MLDYFFFTMNIFFTENLSIVNDPNTNTPQKHLANETCTVTLANCSSGQTFTPVCNID